MQESQFPVFCKWLYIECRYIKRLIRFLKIHKFSDSTSETMMLVVIGK
ncbi:hypothetical protein [Sideroxydans sp. CL21]|nr:hypothetical protein [Sideroxydans sp. CL21]